MSKNAKVEPKKKLSLGRKRDESLDSNIVSCAIEILAEVGFDAMTMDMVAARAKAGKASLYRRWQSKAELVRDALIWMSKSSVELEQLPDTGSLRDDLYALQKPYSAEHSDRKLKVLGGLGSFFSEHRELAEEATSGIFEPLVKSQQTLMKRAVERKEIPKNADIQMASDVIIAVISYRTRIEGKSFDKTQYGHLLDQVIVPALKNPPAKAAKR